VLNCQDGDAEPKGIVGSRREMLPPVVADEEQREPTQRQQHEKAGQHSATECIPRACHIDHFYLYGRNMNPFSGTRDMGDHALCSALHRNQGHCLYLKVK